MSPPLDAIPIFSPEPRLPVSAARVITPDAVHDLRGHPVDELRYPTTAAVIFAGVPGAGKSTALRLFFGATAEAEAPPRGPEGAIVLDSHHARNRWRRRLGWLPYPLWRPVVHIAHYAGIRTALRDGTGPVVIHDCATFGWARRMIARWAGDNHRELHVVLLDVPATVARDGQYARGRRVNGVSFRLHVRRWQRLIRSVAATKQTPVRSSSVVIVDRSTVNRIRRVAFEG
ncbi:AAA family ATPase [Nocardia sp. NPDC050710]|uniref:AAA family ATPase n=1 Tax=Nocardia sp. NPDC050710 TaxID=3157220 RepID=UPI0033E60DF8